MEYSASPRIGKVKSMAGQSPLICIEKLGMNLTPTSIRQVSRAYSLIDAKKGKRIQVNATPKALKPYTEKPELMLISSVKPKNALISKKSTVHFVNESMDQEIAYLKSEIASLKSTLNGAVSQLVGQKEEFKKQIDIVESQKNAYRSEYLSIINFLNSSLEPSSNIRENLKQITNAKHFGEDREALLSFQKLCHVTDTENPLEIECCEREAIVTARFKSLSESQVEEILNPHSEVIALEDFDGDHEEYLKIITGDRIQVLEKIDFEWWLGNLNNKIGRFPAKSVLND